MVIRPSQKWQNQWARDQVLMRVLFSGVTMTEMVILIWPFLDMMVHPIDSSFIEIMVAIVLQRLLNQWGPVWGYMMDPSSGVTTITTAIWILRFPDAA
ncbi:MAG: hypothetical protein A3G34_09050 [Candidatus Lindowbacteria bacterium RIFCSPLOWO2_12_FULL_62_27]|nr:MAG: hypothetical protein A3G34_09050 [Candidatus Lindowbacteria bacterium RIFCSPLOWO2_12_FULL_62_27]